MPGLLGAGAAAAGAVASGEATEAGAGVSCTTNRRHAEIGQQDEHGDQIITANAIRPQHAGPFADHGDLLPRVAPRWTRRVGHC